MCQIEAYGSPGHVELSNITGQTVTPKMNCAYLIIDYVLTINFQPYHFQIESIASTQIHKYPMLCDCASACWPSAWVKSKCVLSLFHLACNVSNVPGSRRGGQRRNINWKHLPPNQMTYVDARDRGCAEMFCQ